MDKKNRWFDELFEVSAAVLALTPAFVAGVAHAGYKLVSEDKDAAKQAFGNTFELVVDSAAEFGRENGATIAKTIVVSVITRQASGAINQQIDKYKKG